MKKRLLSVFLALVLCFGLAVPAFAAVDRTTIRDRSIFDPGTYTLERQDTTNNADFFVAEEIIFDYDLNPPKFNGYYTITEDTTWTVNNTASDDTNLMIAFRERRKEGNHYSSHGIRWIMPDGTFSAAFKTVAHEDLELKSGNSVSFSFKDAIAAMEIEADPDSLYEIEVTVLGDVGDSYLFKIGSAEAGSSTDTKPVTAPAFTDVPQWCSGAVNWAVEKEVTNGTTATTFEPDKTCTQAEILTFLWRAAGKPTEGIKTPLANVKESDFFYDAVQWANDMGMIDPGTFVPSTPCTRSTAMYFICQAFVVPGLSPVDTGFTDVPADADRAYTVAWAVENGVTNGTSATTFGPDETCTRGQIVTFLHRAYVPEARLPVK